MKTHANKIALVMSVSLLLAGNTVIAAPTQEEVNHAAAVAMLPGLAPLFLNHDRNGGAATGRGGGHNGQTLVLCYFDFAIGRLRP